MVMTYSKAEVRGQRSVSPEDTVETNGQTERRTEAIALPHSLMRSVIMQTETESKVKTDRFNSHDL